MGLGCLNDSCSEGFFYLQNGEKKFEFIAAELRYLVKCDTTAHMGKFHTQ